MTNANDPAFPPSKLTNVPDGPVLDWLMTQRGLTKREYFAALAMQALVKHMTSLTDKEGVAEDAAKKAILYADALIAELNKNG